MRAGSCPRDGSRAHPFPFQYANRKTSFVRGIWLGWRNRSGCRPISSSLLASLAGVLVPELLHGCRVIATETRAEQNLSLRGQCRHLMGPGSRGSVRHERLKPQHWGSCSSLLPASCSATAAPKTSPSAHLPSAPRGAGSSSSRRCASSDGIFVVNSVLEAHPSFLAPYGN